MCDFMSGSLETVSHMCEVMFRKKNMLPHIAETCFEFSRRFCTCSKCQIEKKMPFARSGRHEKISCAYVVRSV